MQKRYLTSIQSYHMLYKLCDHKLPTKIKAQNKISNQSRKHSVGVRSEKKISHFQDGVYKQESFQKSGAGDKTQYPSSM